MSNASVAVPNKHVPAAFFGIILGLVGLGASWRIAAALWSLPRVIGEAIMLTATAVWCVLTLQFAAKWIRARAEGLAEFRHPIQCCFIGLVPVASALIGIAIRPYTPLTAAVLATFGIVGQLIFGVYRTGQLWQGGRDPSTTTPVLYLPTVAGSFVSAITLSTFGHPDWGAPFFGVGVLSWLAIESVLVHRLYHAGELPLPLRPTLGIQLAPPTVGCAAYLSISSGPPDLFAQMLLGYGVFQALLMIRLLPWIAKQPFAPSYWAFTFGLSAIATSFLRLVERGETGPIALAAPYVFAAVNLAIGAIALGTLWLLLRGRLLPPPLVPPAVTAPLQAAPRVL
jgi:tellurite resistance protein